MELTGAKMATGLALVFLSLPVFANPRTSDGALPKPPSLRPMALTYRALIGCPHHLSVYGPVSNGRFHDAASDSDSISTQILKDGIHLSRAFYAAGVLHELALHSRNQARYNLDVGQNLTDAIAAVKDHEIFGEALLRHLARERRDPKVPRTLEAMQLLEQVYANLGATLKYIQTWREMWLANSDVSPEAHFETWLRGQRKKEFAIFDRGGFKAFRLEKMLDRRDNSATDDHLQEITGLTEKLLLRDPSGLFVIIETADVQIDEDSWGHFFREARLPDQAVGQLRYLSRTLQRMPILRSSVFQTLLKRVSLSITAYSKATRRPRGNPAPQPNAVRITP